MNDAGATRGVQPSRNGGLALYVHIPFCESKCPYCDFNTYAGIEALMPAYTAALAREIEQWGTWLGRPSLASLFFGGGTPSYLPLHDLQRLMDTIRAAFDLPDGAEATLEANPGDCSPERLAAMHDAGFNRISIGVQSFDDTELAMLGRRHDAERAAQAVRYARGAGFDNVSLDLMFGLPEQPPATWERSVEQAVRLGTDHLSAYALTLEPGTPLEADVRLGRIPEPDPDLAAEMYLRAQAMLGGAGLRQYEISNWATPGRESVHNLAYWRSLPYLGVGPGAHSYLYGLGALDELGVRFANVNPPRTYIQRVNAWQADGALTPDAIAAAAATGHCETVTYRNAMAETMMMGLRLNAGVSGDAFRERFGEGITKAFPGPTAECVDLGLLEWADGALRLTEGGRLLGNEAFSRFVAG
ncbi:MAG: radical SAM family heme chaperone HemW [Chloroflexota bacterium]|nr:radical SAM family heme chaperone HemW [Chloroflexota bacterium]MDE2885404.1 radical SAM family heme chaperone HemW [Chloroflexota bacterium]